MMEFPQISCGLKASKPDSSLASWTRSAVRPSSAHSSHYGKTLSQRKQYCLGDNYAEYRNKAVKNIHDRLILHDSNKDVPALSPGLHYEAHCKPFRLGAQSNQTYQQWITPAKNSPILKKSGNIPLPLKDINSVSDMDTRHRKLLRLMDEASLFVSELDNSDSPFKNSSDLDSWEDELLDQSTVHSSDGCSWAIPFTPKPPANPRAKTPGSHIEETAFS